MVFRLFSAFPRLIVSPNRKEVKGYVSIYDVDYYVEIKSPNFPSIRSFQFDAELKLLEILDLPQNEGRGVPEVDCEEELIVNYLKRLQKSCEAILCQDDSIHRLTSDGCDDEKVNLSEFLTHIELLGWDKLKALSHDFKTITFQTRDSKGRPHSLQIEIPSSFPSKAPIANGDLPISFEFTWRPEISLLSDIFTSWVELVESLSLFWDVLDAIDEDALVLDPEKPTRRHHTRRIVLDNRVSLHMSFSPTHPNTLPKCHLLGPSADVSPLNDKIAKNYDAWDPLENPLRNIERILEASVIRKQDNQLNSLSNDVYDFDCAVCYALHLDQQLPDMVCDHCKKRFHVACLYEWLISIPSSRQSLQVITGECPYCTKTISCSRFNVRDVST